MKYLNQIHAVIGKETVKEFTCEYWGGNDDGNIEKVKFSFYDGKKDEDLPEDSHSIITEMCVDIVVGSYGRFSGEFNAYGTIHYEAPCDKYPNGRLYNTGYDLVEVEHDPLLQLEEK